MRSGLALVLLLAVLPGPASGEMRTYVLSPTVAPGTSSQIGGNCGGMSLIGGGFDTLATTSLQNERSGPELDGTQWAGAMFNSSGATEEFFLARTCIDREVAPVQVDDDFSVPANAVSSRFAFCPEGLYALNGGVFVTGAPGGRWTLSLAPAWPFDPGGSRLRDRDAGDSPGPTAWEAVVRNDQQFVGYLGTVSALCLPASAVVTRIEAGAVGAGAVGSDTVFCPDGTFAVGGGVDADDRTGLTLVASAPVFFGFPFATPITQISGSTTGEPIGWRVTLRSDAATPRSYKAAAICVPEPSSFAGGLAATAGLLALRSRRRR
jgi:hypothetical protein